VRQKGRAVVSDQWITRAEVSGAIDRFERALAAGLERIETQLVRMNGTQKAHGEAIAVLEDRSDRAEHAVRAGSARWGSLGAIVGGAVASFIAYWTASK